VALARRGEYERAEKLLKDSLERRGDFTEARIVLGKIYAQQGRYDEAIEEWQKVLEKDSENREVKAAIRKAKEMRDKAKDFPIQRMKLRAIILFLLVGLGVSVLGNVWQGIRVKTSLELLTPSEEPREIDLVSKTAKLFEEDKRLCHFEIKVKQIENTICLSGEIPTFYVHNLLINLVKGVPHVKAVDATEVKVTGAYVVKKGETLISIAHNLYGDGSRWNELFQKNKNKLKDPNQLYPGMKISVPLF